MVGDVHVLSNQVGPGLFEGREGDGKVNFGGAQVSKDVHSESSVWSVL